MRSDVVEELFKAHYNGALLYTASLCKNFALAEDVVSEAFFKALSSADADNFKAWLFAVCRNAVFSLKRKKLRQVALTVDYADDNESAVDKIIKDERYAALYRAVSLLPDNYREAITLFYFEELSIKDVAKITQKSETATKVTLMRAREKLKSSLELKNEL